MITLGKTKKKEPPAAGRYNEGTGGARPMTKEQEQALRETHLRIADGWSAGGFVRSIQIPPGELRIEEARDGFFYVVRWEERWTFYPSSGFLGLGKKVKEWAWCRLLAGGGSFHFGRSMDLPAAYRTQQEALDAITRWKRTPIYHTIKRGGK